MEAVGLIGLLVMGWCCCCAFGLCYLRMRFCRYDPSLGIDDLEDEVRKPKRGTGAFAGRPGLHMGMGRMGRARCQKMGGGAFRQVPDEHVELDPWRNLKSTSRLDQ